MMNSFCLSYISNEGKNNAFIDLHVNYFKQIKDIYLKKEKKIDFGIRIYNKESIKKLNILLPFYIKPSQFYDLFDCITNSQTIDALFNTKVLSVNTKDNVCLVKKEDQSNLIILRINKYTTCRSIVTEDGNKVSEISININDLLNSIDIDKAIDFQKEAVYLRFRLTTKLNSSIIKQTNINKVSIISSGNYVVSQIIDFRFNEVRSINKLYMVENVDSINSFLLRFNDVRFSTIEPIDFNVDLFDNNDRYKVRALENKIWSLYLNDDNYTQNMLSHAWYNKGDGVLKDDYIKLFKRHLIKLNNFTSFLYILISFSMGCLASYLIYVLTL